MEKKHRIFTGIAFRLLVFNVLLVFLPAAFFFFLSTFEQQLLKYLENGLVQQGRILGAALGGGDVINPEQARAVVSRLRREHEARYRILDAEAKILVDSSGVTMPSAITSTTGIPITSRPGSQERAKPPAEQSPLYRIAIFPIRVYRKYFSPPQAPIETVDYYEGKVTLSGREVSLALAGSYGAATRISPSGQASVTLYSALPVWNGDRTEVLGVVLVSQSTYRLLRDLYGIRLDIFKIFLGTVAAAVVISIFLSITIARPLRRLGIEALKHFDANKKFEGKFSYQRKRDEIGALARALNTLTARLKEHIADMESFAGDVSHELKNPLASIRSASELALDTLETEDRDRFFRMILSESVRMEALLSSIREVSILDGRLDREEKKLVELGELSETVLESFRIREQKKTISYQFKKPAHPVYVNASPERIVQIVNNLADNAIGFSPENGTVFLSVEARGLFVFIRVEDEGPGIPDAMKADVFKRFFSYRPGEAASGGKRHSGLGLSIVKAIVDRYDGTIHITDNNPRGAVFTVRFFAAFPP